MPGLGTSFGFGGATTFPHDLVNSDAILIMGSNMAEAHPIAFASVVTARERGTRVVHIDPRFSRTSALADTYICIRAGTDIAFLGGVINWLLTHERYFREYVLAYTNASFVVNEEFRDTEDLGGLFSGFDAEKRAYTDTSSWQYRRGADGRLLRDPELAHPNCVLSIVKRHFARYTPEMVAGICGCSADEFLDVCRTLADNSGRERTSAICYSVGWTQHSHGVQNIRAAAIVQLLLGNMGRPGGGIMALRGHASIQGSTDIPTLYDLLSGYMPQPSVLKETDDSFASYVRAYTRPLGYWSACSSYLVSLLKAWYGGHARRANAFCYDLLAKTSGDHSHLASTFAMIDGNIRGMLLMGQNPAAGSAHAKLQRQALAQLDWLVVRDFFETESASFWYASPDGVDPRTIKTEVFFLPAASHLEKEGSFTNTQRMVQWREQALDPPGDARSDAWFINWLAKRLKDLYADSTLPRDRAIQYLTWDYGGPLSAPDEPDMLKVLREINGYRIRTGRHLTTFAELKDDGSTACGSWIYCGIYPKTDRNRAASKDNRGRVFPNWGYTWPLNQRILYNRASADPAGRPWSERKKYIWWDESAGRWAGEDVPHFPVDKRPDAEPAAGATGMDAVAGDDPFIVNEDGKGRLFAPARLADGPLPAHYEPVESPVRNALYEVQHNPTAKFLARPENELADVGDPRFPIVMTTHRLTEHHVSGAMTRWLPWLAELQPEAFVEISPQLARAKGIRNGGWMTVTSARGKFEGRALVTPRIKPLTVGGRTVHQIGVPMHWSYRGVTTGDTPNDLTHLVVEPTVSIFEVKAITCDVRAGRKTPA